MFLTPTRLLGGAVGVTLGLAGLVAPATTAVAAPDTCSALTAPIYRMVNPTQGAQLLTPWKNEADLAASRYHFIDNRGVLGYGALKTTAGLAPAYRFHHPKTGDFTWAATSTDVAKATGLGYVKQNVVTFHVATAPSACTVPVHRYVKGKYTQTTTTAAEQKALVAAGWKDVGISFYVGAKAASPKPSTSAPAPTPSPSPSTSTPAPSKPAPSTPAPTTTAPAPTSPGSGGQDSDGTFSIAVIGDTQKEVHDPANKLYLSRTNWLAANKSALDLRYVLHTGDVVNWGWLDKPQYTRAKAAMDKLTAAGLPYSVTIGNHDTRAVGWNSVAGSTGYGGSAYASNPECPTKLSPAECHTPLLVRKTQEFNDTFPLSKQSNLGGAFEAGKIDNNWTTFSANKTKWLVLTLELWPRKTVVDWAKQVVASHPDHNVIIETHHYLDGNATVSGSNGGYGETSPKYLYDNVVSKYPNVKIVVSGHTGAYANRTDKINGNTVLSYLGNDLGNTNNPVRVLTVNTKTGTVSGTIHNPIDKTTKGSTTGTITITR